MFYLANFCRICVQTSAQLISIDAEDSDAIRLSDKLRQVCEKMVNPKKEHSDKICNECVQKLRIAYQFQEQCARSDAILQSYMTEITSLCPGKEFVNSDLRITVISPLRISILREFLQDSLDDHQYAISNFKYERVSYKSCPKSGVGPTNKINPIRIQRKLKHDSTISETYKQKLWKIRHISSRVSKKQRCSLLKSLLSKNDISKPAAIPARKSERISNIRLETTTTSKTKNNNKVVRKRWVKPKRIKNKGGLRDLLGFIKNYDFGYTVNENDIKDQCDSTVLNQLERFSKTFFYNDFKDYRDTILAIASDCESSDEEDMFAPYDEEEDYRLWPECHKPTTVQKQIKREREEEQEEEEDESHKSQEVSIKMEIAAETPTVWIPDPMRMDTDCDGDILPSQVVQTCYEEEEPLSTDAMQQTINQGFQHFMWKMNANLLATGSDLSDPTAIVNNVNRVSVIPEASTSSNLTDIDLLTRLTNSARLAKDGKETTTAATTPAATGCAESTRCYVYHHHKYHRLQKTFINPQLMQQFETQTFKCGKCNRSFKSPGYLQSHCTKMGH